MGQQQQHDAVIETTGGDHQNIVKDKAVIVTTNTSTKEVDKGMVITTNTSECFDKDSNIHKGNDKKDTLVTGKTSKNTIAEKYESWPNLVTGKTSKTIITKKHGSWANLVTGKISKTALAEKQTFDIKEQKSLNREEQKKEHKKKKNRNSS